MKKLVFFVAISALNLFQSCEKNVEQIENGIVPIVVQAGVLKYFETGAFGGLLPIGTSLLYGDFGLATLTGLDGELTILNNKIYRLDTSGVVNEVSNSNDSAPYFTVAYFKTDFTKSYPYSLSLFDLQKSIDSLLFDSNAIYAIKIYGNFDSLTTRTYYKILPPYPTLAVARLNQVVFNYTNVVGTGVGFWYPRSFVEINHPGYHFHFISDNLQTAGHILNAKLNNVIVSIGLYKFSRVLKY